MYAATGTTASGGTYPTTPKVHGIAFYQQDGIDWILVFVYQAAGACRVWRTPYSDIAENSGTWTYIGEITMLAGWENYQFDFTVAFDKLFIVHPYMESTYIWDPTGGGLPLGSGVDAPTRGRCVQFHKQRVFIGGGWNEGATTKFYSRLWYSDAGDATGSGTWNATPTYSQFIDVEENDGEPIEALLPYNNGMLIAKRTTMWFLAGDGPNTFELIKVASLGGRGPNSLCMTPAGVVMGNEEGLFLWRGGGDPIPIHLPIENYIAARRFESKWMHLEYLNNRIYQMQSADWTEGQMQVYDLANQFWFAESGPDNTAMMKVIKGHLCRGAYHADTTTTNFPLLWSSRRPSSETPHILDENVGVAYTAGAADSIEFRWHSGWWELSRESPAHPRHLDLYVGHGYAPDEASKLQVLIRQNAELVYNETLAFDDADPAIDGGLYWQRYRIDLGGECQSFAVELIQTLGNADAQPFHLNDCVLRFAVGAER
jgi:hypothetical protein